MLSADSADFLKAQHTSTTYSLHSTEKPLLIMATSKCTICGKDTTTQCSVCKAAPYCSAVCQKKDRPFHALLCDKYQPFIHTRPTATEEDKTDGDVLPVAYKMAILFPATSDTPQLIWLKVHTQSWFDREFEEVEDPKWHFYQNPICDLLNYMECPRATPHTRNGRDLDIYMGDGQVWKEPITQSLLTLTAGYGPVKPEGFLSLPGYWAGDLVVVKVTKERVEHSEDGTTKVEVLHGDVNLADFRAAFDYLTRYYNIFESANPNPYYIRQPGRWVKAVKICCSGEMKFEHKNKYTEVSISRHHPLFSHSDAVSGISKHLGFPLLVKRLQSNPQWKKLMENLPKNSSFDPEENPEWLYLVLDVEVESKKWGSWLGHWDMRVDPTVLVARKDMKDLTIHQVEALVSFSKTVVEWEMDDAARKEAEQGADADDTYYSDYEDGDELAHIPSQKVRREFLEEYLLSDKFEKFFEEFKQEKLAEGDATWSDAIVPSKS